MSRFSDWLVLEMNRRGWSMRETADRAGISHMSVSRAAEGETPGEKVIRGLARAFDMNAFVVAAIAWDDELPPESLPTAPDDAPPRLRDIWRIIRDLDEEGVETLENYARFLLEQRRPKKNNRPRQTEAATGEAS